MAGYSAFTLEKSALLSKHTVGRREAMLQEAPAVLLELSNDCFSFFCPGCNTEHVFHTGPGQWIFDEEMDCPTFSPSLLTNGDLSNSTAPRCRLFIRDGQIIYLDDCTHGLAGTVIPMVKLKS